jgi:hypothetical protein
MLKSEMGSKIMPLESSYHRGDEWDPILCHWEVHITENRDVKNNALFEKVSLCQTHRRHMFLPLEPRVP